jgi:hypothetical protein
VRIADVEVGEPERGRLVQEGEPALLGPDILERVGVVGGAAAGDQSEENWSAEKFPHVFLLAGTLRA